MACDRKMTLVTAFLLCWAMLVQAAQPSTESYTQKLAPLLDPAKLATLGQRGANPRLQKAVYWMETARKDGINLDALLDSTLKQVQMSSKAAALTKETLLRNRMIAERLGCLGAAGLAEMRQGKAATVEIGPYRGDQLSVDHIIPRAVLPELDNVIANLELMPMRLNAAKGATVTVRQVQHAK